jgi:hypothetical protein
MLPGGLHSVRRARAPTSILNNEASVLESFFQIFGSVGKYFSEFLTDPKMIY